MKNDEFGYALHDIRIGLEKGVKCIIIHWKGDSYIKEKLDDNVTVCKSYALLPRDFVEELYDAKTTAIHYSTTRRFKRIMGKSISRTKFWKN